MPDDETYVALRKVIADALRREYGDGWDRNNAEQVLDDLHFNPLRWPTLEHVIDVTTAAAYKWARP